MSWYGHAVRPAAMYRHVPHFVMQVEVDIECTIVLDSLIIDVYNNIIYTSHNNLKLQ